MSGYRGHLIFYLAIALCLFFGLQKLGIRGGMGIDDLPAFALGALYAVLPDIDAEKSKIRKSLTAALAAAMLLALGYYIHPQSTWLMYAAAAAAAVLLLVGYTRHRGALHTVWAGLGFSLPLLLIGQDYFLMGLAGYVSHLALDGRLFR